jgi:hypothetical protein
MPTGVPTSEEKTKIQKDRTLNDAELLKGGAEYKEGVLMPTDEQIEKIVEKHKEEVKEALIKAYTEVALSYSGTDERVLSDQELLKGGPALGKQKDEKGKYTGWEGKIDDHAEYVINKISGQVILEVSAQQRLELSGRGENVEDAVKRLMENCKEQELARGDTIELTLRDNTTRVGYYDDMGSLNPKSAFDWTDDKKKAYFTVGGYINEGQSSFGIRGHQYIPVQAIEQIVVKERR